MNLLESFAVIGAGNGGKAMAAYLGLMGYRVNLYNRTPDNISAIRARMGIDLESSGGVPCGFGKLSMVTSNMAETVKDAEMIMVVIPSSAHADIAKTMAPHLRDGQIIVLHPGRTFGAIEFVKVLKENGCEADVTVAEAETFIYISRSEGPAKVRIFRVKNSVPLAALPAKRTKLVLEVIRQVFPQFIDGVNVLHTSLMNIGAVFHPTITLLNSGWIEATKGDFDFYIQGVTPTIARILEIIDSERVNIAHSLGIRTQTALEWLQMAYNSKGEDLRDAIQKQSGYYGIKAPSSINHRYVFEDVPTGLVPLASLGKNNGVSVDQMESIIRLACSVHRKDYWKCGRTLDNLGLSGLNPEELTRYVTEGAVE